MFQFDVQIERNIRAIDLVAPIVGTGEVFLDFNSQSSVFLPVFELIQLEILFLKSLDKTVLTSRFSTSP